MPSELDDKLKRAYEAVKRAGGSTGDAVEIKAFHEKYEARIEAVQAECVDALNDAARDYERRKSEIYEALQRDVFDAALEWERHIEDVVRDIHQRHASPEPPPVRSNIKLPKFL